MKTKLAILVLFVPIVAAAWGATSNGLKFVNDDFPKAVADAKQRSLPIFVEVWAPW
jgi:hypothetical protein